MIHINVFGQDFLTKILFNSAKGTILSVQGEEKKGIVHSVNDSMFFDCYVSRDGDS